jgi:O-antigen/teichoic acid export membrane protein
MIRYYKESEIQNKINFTIVVIVILAISSLFICFFFILPSVMTGFISKYLFIIDEKKFFYILLLIITLTLNAFFSSLLRVMQQAFHFFLYTSLMVIANSLLSLYMLAYLKIGYYSLFYSSGIVNSIFTLIGLYYFRNFIVLRRLKFSKSTKILFKNTIPILFSQLSTVSLNNMNRVVLERLSSVSSLGIYSVGARFGNMIEPILLTPIFNAFNPQAYRLYSTKDELFKQELIKFTHTYTIIVSIVFLGALLFFESIFKLLVSIEYWEGYRISIIILLSYLLLGYHNIFSIVYTVKEKLYFGLLLTLITLGLNILLSYFFVRIYGVIGAAIASLLSTFMMLVISYFYNSFLIHINFQLGKIIAVFIATTGLGYWANQICFKSVILTFTLKLMILIIISIINSFFLFGWRKIKSVIAKIKI